MTVAAEIILISTAYQSNGQISQILSYTLNYFYNKLFLYKVRNFSGTFSTITGQNKMKCAGNGQNDTRMRRPKKDAHAHAKMRCACAGHNKMRMCKS